MILFRYVARELASTVFAISLVLLLVVLMGRLIRQLSDAAAGNISIEIVLYAIILRLPSFLEMILPLALFIGIILTLGRMYVDNEVSVLTSTGVSRHYLLKLLALPIGLIMLLVGFSSMWLGPTGAQQMELLYQKQAKVTEFELLVPGRFQSIGRGDRVTYVESLSDDKSVMNRVFIAEGNALTIAESGTQVTKTDTGSRFLELSKGRRYEFGGDTQQLQSVEFDLYGVKIADEVAVRRKLRDEAVPTSMIIGSTNTVYQAQWQWRLSLIILVPITALLAFSLAKVEPRQGRFAKLLPAIILFMVYLSLMLTLKDLIAKGGWSAQIGMWPLHFAFAALAVGLYSYADIKQKLARRSVLPMTEDSSL